jgi:heme/copper-type cytochrome/quinol oxidase subunit 3
MPIGLKEFVVSTAIIVGSSIAINEFRNTGDDQKKKNQYNALIVSLVLGLLMMLYAMYSIYKYGKSGAATAAVTGFRNAARAGYGAFRNYQG